MKKAVPSSVWLVTALSIFFLIGSIAYWSNNAPHDAKATIAGLQKDMQTLVKSARTLPQAKVKTADSIKQKLKDKYVTAPLRQAGNDFFKAWKEPLTEDQADSFESRINILADTLKSTYAARSGNQLVAVLLIAVIVITFFCLAFFTNLLRDPQGNAQNTSQLEIEKMFLESQDKSTENASPPFSLSRTQLAIWITIISCVYVYAILWDRRIIEKINDTALLLMGISAGTFAAGAIIDTAEIQQNVIRHQDIQPSVNFFRDLLSDDNGISVHRFQNLVWTLVAIIVYFYRYNNPPTGQENGLPVLDSTLLALTGISSATYLTLKTRENMSLKKPVTLKINLEFDPAISEETKKAVAAAWEKVSINIINSTGDPQHAALDPVLSDGTYIVIVEPEKFQKIEATWKDTVGATEVSLKGTFTEIIKESPNPRSIKILMK